MKRGTECQFSDSGFPLEDAVLRKVAKLRDGDKSFEANVHGGGGGGGCAALQRMREEGMLESMLSTVPGFGGGNTSLASPASAVAETSKDDPDCLHRQYHAVQHQQPLRLPCDTAIPRADILFHSSQSVQLFTVPSPGSTSSEQYNISIPDLISPHSPSLGSEPPTPTVAKPYSPTTLKPSSSTFEGTHSLIHGNISRAPSVSMPFRTFSSYVSRAALQRESLPTTYMVKANPAALCPPCNMDDTYLLSTMPTNGEDVNAANVESISQKATPQLFRPPRKFVPPLVRPDWHPNSSHLPNPTRRVAHVPPSYTSTTSSSHHVQPPGATGPSTETAPATYEGSGQMSAGDVPARNGGGQWQSLMKMVSLEGGGRGSSRKVGKDLVGSGAVRPGTYVIEVPTKIVPSSARDGGRRLVFARSAGPGAATPEFSMQPDSMATAAVPGLQGAAVTEAFASVSESCFERQQVTAAKRPWEEVENRPPAGLGELGEFLRTMDVESSHDQAELLRILEEEEKSRARAEQEQEEVQLLQIRATGDLEAKDLSDSLWHARSRQADGFLTKDQQGLPPGMVSVAQDPGTTAREELMETQEVAAAEKNPTDYALDIGVQKSRLEKQTLRRKLGPSRGGISTRDEGQQHGFQKAAIKRLAQAVSPQDSVISAAMTEALAEVAKLFVIELIQKGRSLMGSGEEGQRMKPHHVREAYRQLKEAPCCPTGFRSMTFR